MVSTPHPQCRAILTGGLLASAALITGCSSKTADTPSAPPPPGPADWRDRATVLAATAGILARGAVRRGRRKLGWVG